MFEDYIKKFKFIYETNNYLWHSWEKLERETKKIFKHSKLPRKEKEHLTHWVIFSSTYLVLLVVKSLPVIRALIVLKWVTSSTLRESLLVLKCLSQSVHRVNTLSNPLIDRGCSKACAWRTELLSYKSEGEHLEVF